MRRRTWEKRAQEPGVVRFLFVVTEAVRRAGLP
jgi:hypothetical protein